jgi:hypothetical protein
LFFYSILSGFSVQALFVVDHAIDDFPHLP